MGLVKRQSLTETMPPVPSSPPDMLALLRGVSRSFYLSIRLLPAPLRRPIAVAYLLARATDTVADTADLPAPEREEKLRVLSAAIEGQADAARLAAMAASFAPLQRDADERELILALPKCLEWLDSLQADDRDDVHVVLRHIAGGQALDISRFGMGGTTHALTSAAELDDYTYRVAGCVGEFWTELCFRHLPGFSQLPK